MFGFMGTAQAQVDKLYVIECGEGHAADMSRWTPGENAGVAMDVVDNCYLIHHTRGGWMLWDTGVADAIAKLPDGTPPSSGPIVWKRPKTLVAEMEKLGVKTSDVKFVAVSHTHADHVGNLDLFPQAMLLVQKAEYDWPGPNNTPRFKPEQPVTKLDGDKDVFGDGSVVILATPGHTPGHQSLLVKLQKTGAVVLSGDAAHFRDNWEKRRVPGMNTGKAETVASMDKLAGIIAREKAQLWINHDKPQSATMKRPPAFYE
jgi:glyoxylase-like metal-dependent hydrolase (beta-lactamase superfamily II)